MTQLDKLSASPMIFTLEDEHAARLNTQHEVAPDAPTEPPKQPARFGDAELDLAYREYLHQREREHNQRVEVEVEQDIGLLIEEDWLAAQTALQSERNRRYIHATQTVIINGEQPMQKVDLSGNDAQAFVAQNALPPFAVHVYDLPDLPSTRRIRVISEQELMESIQEKLQVHLSNAVAGMVRQAVQRKLATLTYDLQVALNDETAKVVDDVLQHNLAAVFRSVKDSMR